MKKLIALLIVALFVLSGISYAGHLDELGNWFSVSDASASDDAGDCIDASSTGYVSDPIVLKQRNAKIVDKTHEDMSRAAGNSMSGSAGLSKTDEYNKKTDALAKKITSKLPKKPKFPR